MAAARQQRMLLYKYTSCEAGLAILKTQQIGYAQPRTLNDPFEVSAFNWGTTESEPEAQLGQYFDSKFEQAQLKTDMAILSLSREPLNALMWAHYGQSHTGFVIGFDAESAGFADRSCNLIPAQFGSIVYSNTKPTHSFVDPSTTLNVGNEYSWRPEIREQLDRLFLYKAGVWSYEEEVRVVKNVKNHEQGRSGQLTRITAGKPPRPLYAASFPPEAVRRIYLGACNPLINSDCNFRKLCEAGELSADLFECHVDDETWQLKTSPL